MDDTTAAAPSVRIASAQPSADGSIKYAFTDARGDYFEAISYRYEDTRGAAPAYVDTVCLSSQVGCAMACTFCATGYGGFRANLTLEQLLLEAALVQSDLQARGRPPATAYALMGMGEPLMNYANVVAFFARVRDEGEVSKLGLSTVGVTPRIQELGERADLPINLTVSFHAPNDEERVKFIPLAATYPLAGLVAACRAYAQRKQRKVRASYLLFDGRNDSERHAQALARLLDPTEFEIKVLLFNAIEEVDFGRPTLAKAVAFRDAMKAAGYAAHIDVSMGQDVAGGCGQLARRAGAAAGPALSPNVQGAAARTRAAKRPLPVEPGPGAE
jgi:23S rRNA (adenine2503-C2)-methyltransferase